MQSGLKLPDGLAIRPARPSDRPFIECLYYSTRDDLQYVDGEQEFIDTLIQQQFNAQGSGYGDSFPNAMYFIIEKLGDSIGRITIDFGSNEIRLVDIAFIRQARGRGFGEGVLRALQYAAVAAGAPLTLTVNPANLTAKALYLKLGFQVDTATPMAELMIWYPPAAARFG